MNMVEKLKSLKLEAMRNGQSAESTMYGVVLGEIQLATSRKELTEDQIVKLVRKYRDSCNDNWLKYGLVNRLAEVELLDDVLPVLPVMISRDYLASLIRLIIGSGRLDDFRDNLGRCTGEVIRSLKIEQINFNAGDIRGILEEEL